MSRLFWCSELLLQPHAEQRAAGLPADRTVELQPLGDLAPQAQVDDRLGALRRDPFDVAAGPAQILLPRRADEGFRRLAGGLRGAQVQVHVAGRDGASHDQVEPARVDGLGALVRDAQHGGVAAGVFGRPGGLQLALQAQRGAALGGVARDGGAQLKPLDGGIGWRGRPRAVAAGAALEPGFEVPGACVVDASVIDHHRPPGVGDQGQRGGGQHQQLARERLKRHGGHRAWRHLQVV